MRRFATLVGLTLRELWISYRLLATLGALLLAALPVALAPQEPTALGVITVDRPAWYAIALGAALALAAGIAGATLAGELRRGTMAWLALRAVPRTTLLLAWFVSFGVVAGLGLAASATLAALSLPDLLPPERIGAYVAVSGAVVASGLAAVAAGLLIGTMARPLTASLLSILLVGVMLLVASIGPAGWPAGWPTTVPSAGLALLGDFDGAARPIADALRSSGSALAVAAGLLVLAAARVERVDL